MRLVSLLQLVILAAIWGSSFIFMRVLAPVLGPIATADFRVMIAGLVLMVYFYFIRFDPEWKKFWKQYLVIGTINSAIPFSLFSYAALHLPASYEVILNSSSPLFGAVFSAIWLGDRLTLTRVAGLIVGAFGVGMVMKIGAVDVDAQFGISIVACLIAAACYGVAAVYMKKFAPGVKPAAVAGCSQVLAGLVMLPAIPFHPPTGPFTWGIIANILGLALLCSAFAYLLYYRLIEDLGPTKALTVTFLMPVFGMLWGSLLLGEKVTAGMIGGCLLIIAGTGLVLRIRISNAVASFWYKPLRSSLQRTSRPR